jgi:hypothetical protein
MQTLAGRGSGSAIVRTRLRQVNADVIPSFTHYSSLNVVLGSPGGWMDRPTRFPATLIALPIFPNSRAPRLSGTGHGAPLGYTGGPNHHVPWPPASTSSSQRSYHSRNVTFSGM